MSGCQAAAHVLDSLEVFGEQCQGFGDEVARIGLRHPGHVGDGREGGRRTVGETEPEL